MSRDITLIAFRQPEAIDDPLSELAGEGARRMLAQVLIAEADFFAAGMLELLRNPANWDNFRKAAVLVLIIWAAASVLFGIIYFFIFGGPQSCAGRKVHPGRLFCLSPLSLRSHQRLAQVQEPGGTGSQARGGRGVGTVTIAELLTQKNFFSELLLITEPELSLRDRRSEWLCDGFLCDHPGSLDGRVRNDAADCADAAKCDADCNDQSNGELLAAALTHD